MIIIDANEPEKVRNVFSKAGIPFKVEALAVGDFTNVKGTFIAERKSVNDFWSSMSDNRLLRQITQMYEKYNGNRYIFVEWNSLKDLGITKFRRVKDARGNWVAKGYYHWIYSTFGIAENFGVHFREYYDIEDLARKLDALDKNLGNKKIFRDKPKSLKRMDVPIKMLMQAGGVGKKKCKLMLSACGSYEEVIKDLLYNKGKKLAAIKGIAPLPKGKILSDMLKEVKRKYV